MKKSTLSEKKSTLSEYVVRFSNGRIDEETSIEKFMNEVQKLSNEENIGNETYLSLVNAVFDQHSGKTFTMPCLVNSVINKLNTDNVPDNYSYMFANVQKCVQDNIGTKEDGLMFGSKKGKGGGVFRWADTSNSK